MNKLKLKHVIDVVAHYQVVSRMSNGEFDCLIDEFDTYNEAFRLIMNTKDEEGYFTIELVLYGRLLGEDDFEIESIIPHTVLLSTKTEE